MGVYALWEEAGDSINYLIDVHKDRLTMAFKQAEQVKGHLKSLFHLLDELCFMTCLWCPEPCCSRATVWADFKDLLFFALQVKKFPRPSLFSNLQILAVTWVKGDVRSPE
ncbi:MAG: hypothetical protein ACKVE4_11135 [Dissulfuribacterales bacterium]